MTCFWAGLNNCCKYCPRCSGFYHNQSFTWKLTAIEMKIIRMRFQATQAFMLLLAITAAFLTSLLPANGQTALTESTRIQTNGMMPIEIGMTVKQAEGVSGTRLIGGVVINQCYYVTPQNGSSGVAFMVKNSRIARVDVRQNQRILTRRGAKIGDTRERLNQLYGTQLKRTGVPLSGRGEVFTFFPIDPQDQNYRLVFETNQQGRIVTYRAGKLPEVEYVEGCV